MRGDVIDYQAQTGAGLISGDDGQRYAFGPDNIGRAKGLRIGARVDFEVVDGAANNIFPLVATTDGRTIEPDLGLWGYFVKCMKLYFDGRGRATRKEYWSFMLFRFLFMMGFVVVLVSGFAILAASAQAQSYDGASDPSDNFGALWMLMGWILGLPFLAPYWAVSARRLHDVGLSGWLALLMLIPYLGNFFMFVVALIPSQQARNRYDTAINPGVFD